MRYSTLFGLAILPVLSSAQLRISQTARCGAQFGLTCKGSTFGNCCSHASYCGSTAAYCGEGCQPGYGDCTSVQPPKPVVKVSVDGTCGGQKGYSCLGSQFGNCCSQYGWCGTTRDHCGTGCNTVFGTCPGQPVSSSTTLRPSTTSSTSTRPSSAAPSSTQRVSTNARCGHAYDALPAGMTCVGSKFGACCSQYGYWYV